jgi:hypothetical protein
LQLTAAAALPWFLLTFGFARAHNTFFLVLILTLWIATRQGIRGVAAAVMLSNIATLWSLRDMVAPAATNLQSQIMMLGAGLVGLSVGCLVSEIAVASSQLEHQTVVLNALQDHSPLATVARYFSPIRLSQICSAMGIPKPSAATSTKFSLLPKEKKLRNSRSKY